MSRSAPVPAGQPTDAATTNTGDLVIGTLGKEASSIGLGFLSAFFGFKTGARYWVRWLNASELEKARANPVEFRRENSDWVDLSLAENQQYRLERWDGAKWVAAKP